MSLLLLFNAGVAGATLTGQAAVTGSGVFAFNDTTQGLTGLPSTTAGGLLTPAVSVTLTGLPATTAPGALGVSSAAALLGLASTTAQGTLSPAGGTTAALTGLAVTTGQGALTPVAYPLGRATALAQGALGPGVAVTPLGRSATATGGLLPAAVTWLVALLGRSVATEQGVLSPSAVSTTFQELTGLRITTGFNIAPPPRQAPDLFLYAFTSTPELYVSRAATELVCTTIAETLVVQTPTPTLHPYTEPDELTVLA